MQSKEETRNETVRKRNHGNKQAEHDETLSAIWNESIKAGRQITEPFFVFKGIGQAVTGRDFFSGDGKTVGFEFRIFQLFFKVL